MFRRARARADGAEVVGGVDGLAQDLAGDDALVVREEAAEVSLGAGLL